ncbi:MAG: PAS domain S-box protein, partial [Allopontixanthobacter sediminis]
MAAFHTGVTSTALAVAIIAPVASIATTLETWPIMLVEGGRAAQLMTLQLFLASSFAVGLPVAAALAWRASIRTELRASRDFNRSILDNIQEVIFRTDAHGQWVFLNPAWEKVTGFTVAESLGWSTVRLLNGEDRDTAMTIYPRIASGEIGETVLHQRFVHASGELRHIEVMVRRLCDEDGTFIGTTGNIRDITDRIRHERDLADSDSRFRRMAEAAPVGIFRADAKGQVTYVNRVWCQKLGLSVDEALGDGWKRALAEGAPYENDPAFTGFARPGDVRRRTVRFLAAGGADMWVETVNAAEFGEDGAITGFVGVINDITEQRAATQRLTDSERRFQALANLAPAGIFRTDADGHCTYVNSAWLRITGLGPDDWQGEGWTSALHPEDAERVFEGWTAAVDARTEYRAEFRWVKPNGSAAWTDVSAAPEFDQAGQVTGFIGVTMDITERRLAEGELAARDEQLMLLANNATDAVFRLALDGHCLYASPSARNLLGIAPEHLVGARLLDRFHPDDDGEVMATFAALSLGDIEDRIIAYRSETVGRPGTYRWMEAHCGLVRDTAGAPREIIASIRDVSAAKALESDLHEARLRAEAAAGAKAAFLANMSHEIRTPMNGVLGFTELLAGTDLDPDQERHVQMIFDSGRAMMHLLNDILDRSKIDSGQMRLTSEPVDLEHKLRNSARLMEPLARSKGVELTITSDPDLPRHIVGDPLRIRQILLNLIGNAVKFTDDGTIQVRSRREGDELLVEVIDSGVGIPADRLDAIFEQFSQADTTTARKYGGTGLGLSISTELARMMGGSIAVASTPGEGSTFT